MCYSKLYPTYWKLRLISSIGPTLNLLEQAVQRTVTCGQYKTKQDGTPNEQYLYNNLSNLKPALISLFSDSSFLIWFSPGGYISEVNQPGRELFRSISLLRVIFYNQVIYTLVLFIKYHHIYIGIVYKISSFQIFRNVLFPYFSL